MFANRFGNDLPNMASQFGVAGGFVPSPAQDAGQASQGTRKYTSGRSTLRAVTIKQIVEACEAAKDDVFKVDGEDLHNIVVIARVVAIKQQSTFLQFDVDDGTGRMECKLYVDADDPSAQAKSDECPEGVYARIHGVIRPMDNQYPLVAFSIKPVTDFNEVTYHFLSCVHQHLHFAQVPGKGGEQAPAGAAAPGKGVFGDAGHGRMDTGLDTHEDPMLNAVQAVLDAKRSEMSVDEVAMAVEGRYSSYQVRNALAQLADAGTAYSTTADHFRSCAV